MFMVIVKSRSNHILQAVANNLFLGKLPTRCHTLLLPARMSSVVPHRTFITKFAENSNIVMNIHLAAHLSYIRGECKLLCSES